MIWQSDQLERFGKMLSASVSAQLSDGTPHDRIDHHGLR